MKKESRSIHLLVMILLLVIAVGSSGFWLFTQLGGTTMIGNAADFQANSQAYYEPFAHKIPAVIFQTKGLVASQGVLSWNLQVRYLEKGIIREFRGEIPPGEEMSWDGLDEKGQLLVPGTACQAILTLNTRQNGYQLFATQFQTGVGFKASELGYEPYLGKLSFPRSATKDSNPNVLPAEEVKRLEQLAHILSKLEQPGLTIFASDKTGAGGRDRSPTEAMSRAAFVRRILQSGQVGIDNIALAILPDEQEVPGDIRLLLDASSFSALASIKGKK